MRVAVFGGSFNPPHVGHALVAAWLKWSEEVDQVLLVPCADHPLGKAGLAPFADRLAWCREFAGTVGPWVRVDPIEGSLPRPSYTIHTLEALQARWPDADLRLVVGADILAETHLWRAWDRITDAFRPIVVGRAGYPAVPGAVTFPEVSSTAIRRALGRREPTSGVLPAVRRVLGDAFAGAPLRRSAVLDAVAGVAHGFSDRQGVAGELDLGSRPVGPVRERMWADALRGVDAGLGPDGLVLVDQVHGAGVVVDPEPGGPSRTVAEADAIVSTRPGVAVAIRTADCVPILIAHAGGVAAVHAGWRGVAAGVVPAAVDALRRAVGAGPLVAAVGPHISAEAYETGPEVVAAIVAAGVPEHVVRRAGERRDHTDLGAAVAHQLRAVGVQEVDRLGGCTFREATLHSHRRDAARSGRQAAIIARVA